MVKWLMKGKYVKACNCDPGCPCEFWAKPTHHKCEGMLGMHVDEGHYGRTSLKGINWVIEYAWPGPLHEGNGTVLPILDERTSPAQREALLTILSGNAGEGWFKVVASLVETLLPNGMEYKRGAVCQAPVNRAQGEIRFDIRGGHTTLAHVEHTHAGLKR